MPPRKAHRRSFGSVTREPSGRYRARYTGPDGRMRSVPGSFATKAEAEARLAGLHSQMFSGTYRAPELGAVPFEEYALRWLDRGTDLAPRTHALCARLLRRWVLPSLDVPSYSGTRSRAVQLGAYELREFNPPVIEEWFDAVKHAARASATGRAANASRLSDAQAVRAWARAGGFEVKSSGRMPRAVLDAWAAAGSPKAPGTPMVGADPGRTQAAQAYRLLRAILAQTVREHLIAVNPCQVARAGHVRTVERTPATPLEAARVAQEMPPRYRAAVIVAAWSGLRASELFGLQCGNSAIVTAPFLSEFRDPAWISRTAATYEALDAVTALVWVHCDAETMHGYIRYRGAARDAAKLADWPAYLSTVVDTNLRPSAPHHVIQNSASSAPLQDQARELLAKLATAQRQ